MCPGGCGCYQLLGWGPGQTVQGGRGGMAGPPGGADCGYISRPSGSAHTSPRGCHPISGAQCLFDQHSNGHLGYKQ